MPVAKGWPVIGHVPDLRKKGFLQVLFDEREKCGDIFRIKLGPQPAVIVSHPDGIERVLASRIDNYVKGATYDPVRQVVVDEGGHLPVGVEREVAGGLVGALGELYKAGGERHLEMVEEGEGAHKAAEGVEVEVQGSPRGRQRKVGARTDNSALGCSRSRRPARRRVLDGQAV